MLEASQFVAVFSVALFTGAALLIRAVVPFTFLGIMPTNRNCWPATLDQKTRDDCLRHGVRCIRSARH